VVITSINIDGNLFLIGSHQKEKVGPLCVKGLWF
ncbi:hypothetical protein CISIN_1g0217141mg, partial [Citrus sinensis]